MLRMHARSKCMIPRASDESSSCIVNPWANFYTILCLDYLSHLTIQLVFKVVFSASSYPPPRVVQPERSIDRRHHGIEYTFMEPLFDPVAKAQLWRAWDGISRSKAYYLDPIDWRTEYLIVALYDPIDRSHQNQHRCCHSICQSSIHVEFSLHISANEKKAL